MSLPKAAKEVNSWVIKGTHAGVDMSRIDADRFWFGEPNLSKLTLMSDVELWDREDEDILPDDPTVGKEWIQCTECDYLIDAGEGLTQCELCRKPFHPDCLFAYEKKKGRGYDPKSLDRDARKYRAAALKWNTRRTSKKSTLLVQDSELSDTEPDNAESEKSDTKDHFECRACRTCRFCCDKLENPVIPTGNAAIEPFVVCVKCYTAAHGHCVFPPVPKLHSSVQWVCDECRECNSCGRVTYLNESTGLPSLLTDWALPSFDQCRTCFAGLDKGEYCPVCMKAWSVEWGGDMVQCDACEFWVHVACDDLGSVNLSKLESDGVKYNCPICRDTTNVHRRRRVIDLLKAIDKVALFAEPVSADFMPIYLKVIKQPMDLAKMRKKNYASNLEFIRDFELIIDNAKMFNMPNSPAYRLAEQFHKQGKLLIEKYLLTERKGASKIEGLTVEVEEPGAEAEDRESQLEPVTETAKRAASLVAEKMWKKETCNLPGTRKKLTYEQALEMIKKMVLAAPNVGEGAISPYKRRLSHTKTGGFLSPALSSPKDAAGSTTKPSSGMPTPTAPAALSLEELERRAGKIFGFKSLNFLRNKMRLYSDKSTSALSITVPADFSKLLSGQKIEVTEIANDARWTLFDLCSMCGAFGEPWNLIHCTDCGESAHWFCAGLVAHPNETLIPNGSNPLCRNQTIARKSKYSCKNCTSCRYCNLKTVERSVTCGLCGSLSHKMCRMKYFASHQLNPNMYRLNFSTDFVPAATPATGVPVCEDCVLSQALKFFKSESCIACDSLINPNVAASYFRALPESAANTVPPMSGRPCPLVHCIGCGNVWHSRCIPEFSDIAGADIQGLYLCNSCVDSTPRDSGLVDDVLFSISRVLKHYRPESYKQIQTDFIVETVKSLGISVDSKSYFLSDLLEVFQGPGGNEYSSISTSIPEEAKRWIEWGILHKDFLLGLGNPISELSKKKSASCAQNTNSGETSVRIKRIEDEDLLLAKRLNSVYQLVIGETEETGQENVKPESLDFEKLSQFPEKLSVTQPGVDFMLNGSEIGARVLQLWWQRHQHSSGYIGPRTILKKNSGILNCADFSIAPWEYRKCLLCNLVGDHIALGSLLPIPAHNVWVHTECLAWSFPDDQSWADITDISRARPQRDFLNPCEFEEPLPRQPKQVSYEALLSSSICSVCELPGATVFCQSCHTGSVFHLPCALAVNAAETQMSTQPRVLMDSRCRLLTCGKCLYRHPETERFFVQQFASAVSGIKSSQSVLNQVWSIRHQQNVLQDRSEIACEIPHGHVVREGTLTIVNPVNFSESDFVYDGSGPIMPCGYAAIRIFWQADLALTAQDEARGVFITPNVKELAKLRIKRRGAYLCKVSEDGQVFSIQFVGGRVVAVGASLEEVWNEFKFFIFGKNGGECHLTGEWFFGLESGFMKKYLQEIAMKSVKRQAGVHRDKWLYQPQLRDFVIEALGLKSDLKPIQSIRRNLTARAIECRGRIDQLASLGRQTDMVSNTLADELLESALVLCEYMGNGEETSSVSAFKPSRTKAAGVTEVPITADTGMKYKIRSAVPDSTFLTVKRSKIHNYGLFAKNGFSKGDMVVEYQGEVLRQTIADEREKKAEREGDGDGGSCYMFKLDDDYVVDATVKGNCSRFINHSCNPHCSCKMIEDDTRQKHIMIIAKRDILPGEEITYDYQFAVESEKLACLCGAPNCLGRLN
jgi:hypothetical protein